jgi:serine/threonine protein kinase
VKSEINNEEYIIKKIKKTGDKKQYSNIFNEVSAMKKIRHPYVISYKESYEEKKDICIVMEYARGGDLHARII